MPSATRASLGRLALLFSERDNFAHLRAYTTSVQLPAVPHLGVTLTDLMFTADALAKAKSAADRQRLVESRDRALRLLFQLQDSDYSRECRSLVFFVN